MTLKGSIASYTVDIVSKRYMTVVLSVFLSDSGDLVPVELTGTVMEVCSKLNAIPISGTLTGKHLKDAGCTILNDRGIFRLVSLDLAEQRSRAI